MAMKHIFFTVLILTSCIATKNNSGRDSLLVNSESDGLVLNIDKLDFYTTYSKCICKYQDNPVVEISFLDPCINYWLDSVDIISNFKLNGKTSETYDFSWCCGIDTTFLRDHDKLCLIESIQKSLKKSSESEDHNIDEEFSLKLKFYDGLPSL